MKFFASWKPDQPKREPRLMTEPMTADRETQLKRAKAYLATIPGAVSGQCGHDHTFKTALKIAAFGLSADDVFDLLADWNQKCEPPWTDAELQHKIDGAFKANPVPMPNRDFASGDLSGVDISRIIDPIPDDTQGHSSERSLDSDELATLARQEQSLKRVLQQGLKRIGEGRELGEVLTYVSANIGAISAESETETFEVITSAELDAADLHTDYYVDEILAAGQPCVIAASKKSLKTTIAIDLTLSLASGAMFLGKFWFPHRDRGDDVRRIRRCCD